MALIRSFQTTKIGTIHVLISRALVEHSDFDLPRNSECFLLQVDRMKSYCLMDLCLSDVFREMAFGF